jgi:hypothetical protein
MLKGMRKIKSKKREGADHPLYGSNNNSDPALKETVSRFKFQMTNPKSQTNPNFK